MVEICSFKELKKQCEEFCRPNCDRPRRKHLFRGQEIAEWRLEPKLDRILREQGRYSRDRWLRSEGAAIGSFEKHARWQLDVHEKHYFRKGYQSLRTDGILALEVMQHHGAPTRLLDWSARWEVAAYFAVAGALDEDGAIWTFDNQLLAGRNNPLWNDWGVPRRRDTGEAHIERVAFESIYPHRWIAAIVSLSPFVRMAVQQGWHTISPQHFEYHDDALLSAIPEGPGQLQKFVIRKRAKQEIREALELKQGVCARTLHWPGADYSAKLIIKDVERVV